MPSMLLTSPLLTPTRLWQFSDLPNTGGLHRLMGWLRRHVDDQFGHWDDHSTVACAWCGHRFPVDPPDPASAGADIHCPAPDCGQPLRLTPFVCDPTTWEKR